MEARRGRCPGGIILLPDRAGLFRKMIILMMMTNNLIMLTRTKIMFAFLINYLKVNDSQSPSLY